MIAGGSSALLAVRQRAWETALFNAPSLPASPSRQKLRFMAGRPALGGTTRNRLTTFGAVRSNATILTHSIASSTKTHLPKYFVCRTPAELGLLSLLFVISMAMGAFFSVAVISLPTMNAFRRLAVSMEDLSKVASEEVPGTLSSLKLSGLEINDLTQQLTGLSFSFLLLRRTLVKQDPIMLLMLTLLGKVVNPVLPVGNDPVWDSFLATEIACRNG